MSGNTDSIHITMKSIINDYSPIPNFYILLLFLIVFSSYLYGKFILDEFVSFTKFSESMFQANDDIKFTTEIAMLYAVLSFTIIFLTFLFKESSPMTKVYLKRLGKISQKRQLEEGLSSDSSLQLYIAAGICLITNLTWFYLFIFSNAGSGRFLRNIWVYPDIFILLLICFGYLANLYVLVSFFY